MATPVDRYDQPDVPEMVRRFFEEVAPGTTLEDVLIRAHDLNGNEEPPFVLLEEAGAIHSAEVPAYLPFRLALTTFGRTEAEAALLYRRVTSALHNRTNWLGTDGFGFWQATDETGPQPRNDASASWPARFGITDLFMPDRPLPTT
jgi:hypothetical protein